MFGKNLTILILNCLSVCVCVRCVSQRLSFQKYFFKSMRYFVSKFAFACRFVSRKDFFLSFCVFSWQFKLFSFFFKILAEIQTFFFLFQIFGGNSNFFLSF